MHSLEENVTRALKIAKGEASYEHLLTSLKNLLNNDRSGDYLLQRVEEAAARDAAQQSSQDNKYAWRGEEQHIQPLQPRTRIETNARASNPVGFDTPPPPPPPRKQVNFQEIADVLAHHDKIDMTYGILVNKQHNNFLFDYSANGKTLPEEERKALDKLLDGWLEQQGMIRSGDIEIYLEADEPGKKRFNQHGIPMKANLNTVESLLQDKAKGLEPFLAKLNVNLKLNALQTDKVAEQLPELSNERSQGFRL